ncbi:MAG: hypothetical protein PHW49_08155 [Acinetobacter harbinensis]|uniref:hypothetical protein n=1 Tax=Acinetobacter terrae TaxID=2731247 RepID=UPI0014905339|nr:hypothetical protein [Acinetobacter terrae]MDD2940686.1 hypothetical protein [Acinetobacter harbinensis]NNG76632.1 hypothetical protein [Acinetobacter terrae]
MTQSWNNARFKKSCLASLIAVLLSPSVYALESLSDDHLAETTGEGIGLSLENFKMVFQGANDRSTALNDISRSIYDTSTGSSYARGIANPWQLDTGLIRIIPTGENYQQLYDTAFEKNYSVAYNSTYQSTVTTNATTYTTIQNSVNNDPVLYTSKYNEFYSSKYAIYEKAEIDRYWDRSKPFNEYQAYYNARVLIYGAAETERMTIAEIKKDKPVVADATAKVVTDTRTWITAEAIRQAQLSQKDPIAEGIKAGNASAVSLTAAQISNKRTKADVFIYGLALSKSDGSLNTRYSNQGFNWGSTVNPWLFRAGTEKVRQFSATEKDLGYIALEAPLATVAANEADNNIKLGFWTDIFARSFSSSNSVDPMTGAPDVPGDLLVSERLRLQFVANGLSLNGSQFRLFQTFTSPTKDYSQTLGLASVIRINTNDTPENLTTASTNLDSKGIRISTAAKNDQSDGTASTPALNSSAAPTFHELEGMYIYSPNINLVLGTMDQPFIVASDGNNIILEVTRIPNVPEIYNKIYQNYGSGLGTMALKGSTCNVYQCGEAIKNVSTDASALYQGRTATHSSIAIGSTERIPGTNLLRAKQDNNSTGIMFKNANGDIKNYGSAVIDGVLIQHLKIKTTGL